MMKRLLNLFSLLLLLICSAPAFSQINTVVQTPANLVQNVLIGNGLTASAITSVGVPQQFGKFIAGPNSGLGLDSGIVLSTKTITPATIFQGGTGAFISGVISTVRVALLIPY